MRVLRALTRTCVATAVLLPALTAAGWAQNVSAADPASANVYFTDSGAPAEGGAPIIVPQPAIHDEAEQQLRVEEKQRALGVIPDFNTSNIPDAAPLSAEQKFRLAFRGAADPFAFVAAGIDAAISQGNDGFRGYGEGARGYGQRIGASYMDSFNSAMIGNALLPSVLHQDPRYFRKGTGTFTGRLLYALSSPVRCKNDHGKWVPNYSDVIGNFAAGGIANLYYPATDRGAELTFERALTQTAEGAVGAVFFEFWPDISRHLHNPFHSGASPE